MATNASSPTSYQTVRLMRGRHYSPDDGACVMELASMLAGERFSDHPRAVSPVIAAFLRTYNDTIDDPRRQQLYAYAAATVGTRSSRACEQRRADACRDWLEARVGPGLLNGLPLKLRFGAWRRSATARMAARYAASAHSRHQDALSLVDLLIELQSGIDTAVSERAQVALGDTISSASADDAKSRAPIPRPVRES